MKLTRSALFLPLPTILVLAACASKNDKVETVEVKTQEQTVVQEPNQPEAPVVSASEPPPTVEAAKKVVKKKKPKKIRK